MEEESVYKELSMELIEKNSKAIINKTEHKVHKVGNPKISK